MITYTSVRDIAAAISPGARVISPLRSGVGDIAATISPAYMIIIIAAISRTPEISWPRYHTYCAADHLPRAVQRDHICMVPLFWYVCTTPWMRTHAKTPSHVHDEPFCVAGVSRPGVARPDVFVLCSVCALGHSGAVLCSLVPE